MIHREINNCHGFDEEDQKENQIITTTNSRHEYSNYDDDLSLSCHSTATTASLSTTTPSLNEYDSADDIFQQQEHHQHHHNYHDHQIINRKQTSRTKLERRSSSFSSLETINVDDKFEYTTIDDSKNIRETKTYYCYGNDFDCASLSSRSRSRRRHRSNSVYASSSSTSSPSFTASEFFNDMGTIILDFFEFLFC